MTVQSPFYAPLAAVRARSLQTLEPEEKQDDAGLFGIFKYLLLAGAAIALGPGAIGAGASTVINDLFKKRKS